MSNPLSHEQLAMFMTAEEIKSKVNSSADPGGHDMEGLWHQKLYESKTGAVRNARYVPTRKRKGNSLYESVKEKGVQKPVELQRNTKNTKFSKKGYSLSEGHHRVAAAYDIDPKMLIPVEHSDY
jgi:hypothetical protein